MLSGEWPKNCYFSTAPHTSAIHMSTLFFVHIPKTAGTSFREAAVAKWGKRKVLTDYGKKRHTSSVVAKLIHKNGDLEAFARFLEKSKPKLFCGHTPAWRYSEIFDRQNILTIFRDPVERVVSHYQTAVRFQNYQGTLDQFIQLPDFINLQSIYVKKCTLDDFGFVGITERYNDSLRLINHQYGLDLPCLERNTFRTEVDKKLHRDSLDAATLEKIQELNKLDIELYNKACEIFDQRFRSTFTEPDTLRQ